MLLPIFFILAILVSACGGGSSPNNSSSTGAHTKAPDNKQVLVTVYTGYAVPDINTFDPAKAPDFNSASAIETVFTGLVTLDAQLNIKPALAASWSQSSDKLSWTFNMKPGLKFSDGNPLTSKDVAYSIDRALQPSLKSTTAPYYLRYIKDADKLNSGSIKTIIGDTLLTPDDNTIVIKTTKVVPFFLQTLTFQASYVVEKSLVDKYGTKWTDHLNEGGGNGPFKVLHYIHNKEIDLVPNTNYYGPQPQLKELVLPFYKEEDTTRKDYLVNRLDDAVVPLADYDQDKTRPDFQRHVLLATNYYAMNYNQKPFDNVHIRQAFALSINKDLLVNKIWKGSFLPTNHIIPQGMPGYSPNLTGPAGVKGTAGDPNLAKQLLEQGLKEEGYSSVSQVPSITLTYASAGLQAARDEIAAMQQMWQNTLGISVKINDIDINKLFNDQALGANNPMQFYSGPAWITDYPDPQDWTTLQFANGAAQNGMNYGQNKGAGAAEQQAVQKEMDAADSMTDPTARLQAYNKIEQELVNDVAWIPVEQQYGSGLRKQCVQGWQANSEGFIAPDDWSKVYISTDTPCANATVGS
ncbi:MAG: peptide ABC transporter substrate-binding protein [Ktedonobacteraceae bacterium]|nr:peptide ABC transporter substrate-binding protein [Ktedonobacteraceae bacterium]